MNRLSRRQVVQGAGAVGLGLLAGCGRLPGQAQAPPKVYRIGRFWEGGLEVLPTPNAQALEQGLRDLGYVEGQNFHWEYAFADGNYERLPELAADLVQRRVDVIVTVGHRAVLAAREATETIPIVMAISGGFVGSC
jgi:putative tryptophan/tyrosine transport system substrate-binding protein